MKKRARGPLLRAVAVTPLLSLVVLASACRDPGGAGAAHGKTEQTQRLEKTSCEALLPASTAAAKLGHSLTYKETRHGEPRFHVISCENETKLAMEVFAFDVGCGGGAKERYKTMIRATERSIMQSEPAGTESWASENVYLSWHAAAGCYSTVLLSWRRPRVLLLREMAIALGHFIDAPTGITVPK